MDLSLNKRLIFPLVTLLGFLFTGCEQPDQKPDLASQKADSVATFFVDRVRPEVQLLVQDSLSVWRTPNALQLAVSACLRDRVNKEPLRGLPFQIEREEDRVVLTPEKNSDTNGCVRWVESIPFDFFAQKSERVLLNRWVSGQDKSRSGKVLLQFSVNPWAVGSQKRDDESPVLYLGEFAAPERDLKPARLLTKPDAEASGAQLFVGEVNISSQRRKIMSDGQLVDFNFELKPQVIVYSRSGEKLYRDLRSGQFDLIAYLVATDSGPAQNEMVILNPVEMTESGRIENGSLRVSVRSNLEKRVAIGNLALLIKILPKNIGSFNSIKEFSGLFELGSIHDVSRRLKGDLANSCRLRSADCELQTQLNKAVNFKEMKVRSQAELKSDPLIFGNLRLRFVSIQPGETATQRTVIYTANTCIRDRWTGQPLADTPFTIEYLDEDKKVIPKKVIQRTSNEEGCLTWDSTIFHKYYQPERLFWHDVRIRLASGYSRQLKFALNPWDDKFTFGWDEREFSPEFIASVQQRKKIPSRFFLSSFGYHALRFLYNIDEFMELEVKKTVLVELNPRVLRYSGIINARQQTENLRDGIYLMKVAIQKDYLDPAESGRRLKNQKDLLPPAAIEELGGKVARKEFITAQTHLVRVVDGRIMQPVEFTMRDLRLMRVRANFMIQLETIDERLVQAHQVLREQFQKDVGAIAAEREDLNKLDPETREKFLLQKAEERKKQLEAGFFALKERLSEQNSTLDGFDLTLEKSLMETLRLTLDRNDFTTIRFPQGLDFDLNNFIEKDSGLTKRTFVGPVIFLSNAFSDSVRATDNLDEAKCDEPDAEELVEKGLASQAKPWTLGLNLNPFKLEEMRLFVESEKLSSVQRQNNAYRYSKYYGALKHLCNKSVDDIIAREKAAEHFYKENMPHLASIYNFVSQYNLDYVSFNDRPMTKLNLDCQGPAKDCVEETRENTLTSRTLIDLIQKKTVQAQLNRDQSKQNSMQQFFMRSEQPEFAYFMCRLMAEKTSYQLFDVQASKRYQGWWSEKWAALATNRFDTSQRIFNACMREYNEGSLIVEDRLRVKETGKYTFLGGLQINLNVGESISLSRSHSWGSSFKPLELAEGPMVVGAALIGGMVGGPVGAAAGAAIGKVGSDIGKSIKPISLSMGDSLSSSDGTSISQSTYIVAQIARFHLMLNRYEYCRVVRFKEEFALQLYNSLNLHPEMANLLARGLFVCTGEDATNPIGVEEEYYYFTQHFTEGDMLDQADLYNHPWLLALRGVRDFATFTRLTNSQEVVNLREFTGGLFSPKTRALGWPLAHMENTFRRMLPTFPGLYTLVGNAEKMPRYPLDERISKSDEDLNREVRCTLNDQKKCQ